LISGLVLLPHVFSFFPLPNTGLAENRVLASAPNMPTDIGEFNALLSHIQAYVEDNFPLRTQIISSLNYVRYLLGYSTTKNILVGKDGWLFWDNGTHLAHGLGRTRLSPKEVDTWVRKLEERVAYTRDRGISLYVVPAPQQESIYPEKLPPWLARRVLPQTEIDQIIQAAAAKDLKQIIDVRPSLMAAKAERRLYGPYDTHWNGDGAYVAYREIMTRIHSAYGDLAPLPQSHFATAPSWVRPKGLSSMLGIAGLVEDPAPLYADGPIKGEKGTIYLSERRDWAAPLVIDTDAKSEHTLLLIRDSFSTELIPLLKPHFRRIIIVHLDDGFFRKDLIEKYKPDIVIVEVIENGLRWAMNN
jgi:hypothetical protein